MPIESFWQAPALSLKVRQAGGQVLDVIDGGEPVRLNWSLWFSGRSVSQVGLLLVLYEIQLPRTPDLLPYAVEAWGGVEWADVYVVTEARPFDMALRQFAVCREEFAVEVTETFRIALQVERERILAAQKGTVS